MAIAAQALSAKDFRNPLLKILAMQTKFDSGRKVKAEDLYQPICRMMGISKDEFGETAGIPWVHKWIQWAFQSLRDDGLGIKHGRGTWGLTPNGVDKARSIMVTTSIQSADNMDAEDLANLISAVDVMPMPHTNDGTYHQDPYICSIGLKDHKCMGFYTSNSPVCVGCPAHVLCQRHMMSKLAVMADELHEADLFAEKVAAQAQKGNKADQTSSATINNDPSDVEPRRYCPPADATVIEQTCSGTVVCDHCGGMINDGDTSVWVRKVGPMKNKSMMFHRECCER